jgi:outer membrane lipoprotein SlyB
MCKSIIGLATVAALFALSNTASATDSGAAAGAVTGGVAGAVVGGPVGAAVGAGAGAVAGGAASGPNPPTTGTVVIEQRSPTTREQTCVTDAAGNRTCREVVR